MIHIISIPVQQFLYISFGLCCDFFEECKIGVSWVRAIYSHGWLVVDPWVVDRIPHAWGHIMPQVHELAIVAVVMIVLLNFGKCKI